MGGRRQRISVRNRRRKARQKLARDRALAAQYGLTLSKLKKHREWLDMQDKVTALMYRREEYNRLPKDFVPLRRDPPYYPLHKIVKPFRAH